MTDGKYGNGVVADAALGNPFASMIQLGQDMFGGHFRAAGKDAAPIAAERAVEPVARAVPNVSFAVGASVAVGVRTSTMEAGAAVTVRAAGALPLGSAAQAFAEGLGQFGRLITLPYNMTITMFTGVVCGIGPR